MDRIAAVVFLLCLLAMSVWAAGLAGERAKLKRERDELKAKVATPAEPNEHQQVSTDIWEAYYRALVNWNYHDDMRREFTESGDRDRADLHDDLASQWRELMREWRSLRAKRSKLPVHVLLDVYDHLDAQRVAIEKREPLYAFDKQKMRKAQERVNKLLGCESTAAPECERSLLVNPKGE